MKRARMVIAAVGAATGCGVDGVNRATNVSNVPGYLQGNCSAANPSGGVKAVAAPKNCVEATQAGVIRALRNCDPANSLDYNFNYVTGDPPNVNADSYQVLRYDPLSGRWFAFGYHTQEYPYDGSYRVQVSYQGGDPWDPISGQWCTARFHLTVQPFCGTLKHVIPDGGSMAVGVSSDKLVVASMLTYSPNDDPPLCDYWSDGIESTVVTIDKAALISACDSSLQPGYDIIDLSTISSIRYPASGSARTVLQPSWGQDMDGNVFLTGVNEAADPASNLKIYKISGPATAPTFSLTTRSPSPSFKDSGGALQPGFPVYALAGSGGKRIVDSVKRGSTVWTAQTQSCTPTGDSTARSCVRVMAINTSNSSISQNIMLSGPNLYYFAPAITTDTYGDLMLVFNRSGVTPAAEYVGIWASGRRPSDAPNTLRAPQLLKGSDFTYTSCPLWSRHSAAAIQDDDVTFNVGGQYATSATEWGTWIETIAQSSLPN